MGRYVEGQDRQQVTLLPATGATLSPAQSVGRPGMRSDDWRKIKRPG